MRLCYDVFFVFVFFFKQKTAYEMRISDWSSDVCSSDLTACIEEAILDAGIPVAGQRRTNARNRLPGETRIRIVEERTGENRLDRDAGDTRTAADEALQAVVVARSEEHTSELQSLMRISYAVFCLKKQKHTRRTTQHNKTSQTS